MAARQKTSNSRFSKLLLPNEYVESVHKGGESVFGNDVDWARFYLVRAGVIDASKRGVWSLTDVGRSVKIDAAKATEIVRGVDKQGSAATEDAKPAPEESAANFTEQTL